MTNKKLLHCFPILIPKFSSNHTHRTLKEENWMQKLDTSYIKIHMPLLKESIEKQ